MSAGTDFSVNTLQEVEAASPELPPPAQVAKAVVPVIGTGEGRKRLDRVADEASGRMSVEGEKEWNKEVMGIPKGFK